MILAHTPLYTGPPTDPLDPLGSSTATATVTVQNVAPGLSGLDVTSPINEGAFTDLTHAYIDENMGTS